MKKIILLSLLVITGLFFINNSVYAQDSVLSILPESSTKNIDTSFDVFVNINPKENNVCVVKGTLNFDKISCNSITVASGLYSIVTPTCANPNFTFGIAKCSSIPQNILIANIKGSEVGSGNVFFTNVKVVGVGVFLPVILNSGTYNIESLEAEILVETKEELNLENIEEINIEENGEEVEEIVVQENLSESNNSRNAWTAGLLSVSQEYFWEILILFIIIIIGYRAYYFISQKKNK